MIKIVEEIGIREFEPWSGAIGPFNEIEECGKLDEFEQLIEELCPDGISRTGINDWLWHDTKSLYEALGMIRSESELQAIITEKVIKPNANLEQFLDSGDFNDYEHDKIRTNFEDWVEDYLFLNKLGKYQTKV